MKLEPGMLIKTSYGEDIYRIESITRNCTCANWYDTVILELPPKPQAPHIHIACEDVNPKSNTPSYLNEYDEETLRSLRRSGCGEKDDLAYDYIIILEQDKPIQSTFF